ncbi:CPBP family glutamic-type intramembrane protease [Streptosporangium saharense]|uniref:CPBP family glutamic-type intramembrane protease n=1 Tax=Streptosporangium saharense TaxID=1706840 RepID=UPI0036B16BA3
MTGTVRRARVGFALFALVTVGGGWLFVVLDRVTGQLTGTGSAVSADGSTSGQGLWIVVPALTALVLFLVSRDGAGPLGMTPRVPVRRFAFATLFFPVLAVGCVAAATVSGVATFTPGLPGSMATVLGFLVVKNVLEEFVFRGYGTRTAMALGLRGVMPHVLVGAVWGLWHLPLYLVWMSPADLRAATTLPLAWYVPLFLLGITALAVLYGELRVWTGSIWPGVVLHTVSGALTLSLMTGGHLRFTGPGEVLFGLSPASVASMIVCGGTGLYLLRCRTGRSGRGGRQPRDLAMPTTMGPSSGSATFDRA